MLQLLLLRLHVKAENFSTNSYRFLQVQRTDTFKYYWCIKLYTVSMSPTMYRSAYS